jgi:hypothetical protein
VSAGLLFIYLFAPLCRDAAAAILMMSLDATLKYALS